MRVSNPNPASTGAGRVVVAMSGGIDSSVSAALLVEQGFDVVGIMMRLWSEPSAGGAQDRNRCCTPDQMADARRVAERLGIPFYVIDMQKPFYETVVQPFTESHLAGRTPNPCIECNRQIRFCHLLNRAMALNADYLATGHYARVRQIEGTYELLQAVDQNKDQSYVLHVLGQKELARVKFPVGDYTKDEVRRMAAGWGLPVAEKSESMDLCFLADGDYRRFLRQASGRVIEPGPVTDVDGQIVGQHSGLTDYTIGQRKGLGLSLGRPVYVIAKDMSSNTLVIGDARQLDRMSLSVRNTNWIAGAAPASPISVQVKIRYRARSVAAVVKARGLDLADVEFERPVRGVTAGQAAVFYVGSACIGGGIICVEENR